jgi:hypothetical protein
VVVIYRFWTSFRWSSNEESRLIQENKCLLHFYPYISRVVLRASSKLWQCTAGQYNVASCFYIDTLSPNKLSLWEII